MRERMRTKFKGKLAERARLCTERLLKIASVQMALLVQGLAQGIGLHSAGRNSAFFTFSVSLVTAWIFSTAVYDVGYPDAALRATRLHLSFRESAALVASMLYVLTGLAGYVMAERGDPDPETTDILAVVSFACILVAAPLVGLLVKDAKNKAQMRSFTNAADSVRARSRMSTVVPVRDDCEPGGGGGERADALAA